MAANGGELLGLFGSLISTRGHCSSLLVVVSHGDNQQRRRKEKEMWGKNPNNVAGAQLMDGPFPVRGGGVQHWPKFGFSKEKHKKK